MFDFKFFNSVKILRSRKFLDIFVFVKEYRVFITAAPSTIQKVKSLVEFLNLSCFLI